MATHPSPLPGHTEKIYSIRFHPVASDLLVSSSYDMMVRIWELKAGQEVLCLRGHTDQVKDDTLGDTRRGAFWLGLGRGHPISLPRSSAWPGALMGRSWRR